MALKGIEVGLVLILVIIMLWGEAAAQSGCSNVIIGMASCLNYVTGNSPTPSSSCCSQLANVVQSQPRCLCTVLNGGGAPLGISINETLALALPGACNVQTPPVSLCNAANGPATSPVDSPIGSPTNSWTDSSDKTPDSPVTPPASGISGARPKTVPSSGGDSSNGSIMETVPLHLVVFLLFVASFASSEARF